MSAGRDESGQIDLAAVFDFIDYGDHVAPYCFVVVEKGVRQWAGPEVDWRVPEVRSWTSKSRTYFSATVRSNGLLTGDSSRKRTAAAESR
jgi:hypothetical protein